MDKTMDMRKDNDKCGIPNRHYKSFYKNYITRDEWINDGRRDDSETVLRTMDNSEDTRKDDDRPGNGQQMNNGRIARTELRVRT